MNRKDELQKMIAEEPGDPFLHYALGLEYLAEHNYQEALRCLQQTIQHDPDYTAAYYQLGIIFQVIDIVDVARDYWEKGKILAEKQNDRKTAGEFEEMLEGLEE